MQVLFSKTRIAKISYQNTSFGHRSQFHWNTFRANMAQKWFYHVFSYSIPLYVVWLIEMNPDLAKLICIRGWWFSSNRSWQEDPLASIIRQCLRIFTPYIGLLYQKELFYKYGLTSILTWISNRMPSKMWNEITYPFPNFNSMTVEVWEWVSNFNPQFMIDVITYPC